MARPVVFLQGPTQLPTINQHCWLPECSRFTMPGVVQTKATTCTNWDQSIKELLNDYSPVILSDGSAITKVGKQYVPASFYEKMQALLENQEWKNKAAKPVVSTKCMTVAQVVPVGIVLQLLFGLNLEHILFGLSHIRLNGVVSLSGRSRNEWPTIQKPVWKTIPASLPCR